MTEWLPMSEAPFEQEILVWCTKFAGEIAGVHEIDGMTITTRGKHWDGRSDYPGNGWWPDGGDYYATWCWPVAWQHLPEPPKGITND